MQPVVFSVLITFALFPTLPATDSVDRRADSAAAAAMAYWCTEDSSERREVRVDSAWLVPRPEYVAFSDSTNTSDSVWLVDIVPDSGHWPCENIHRFRAYLDGESYQLLQFHGLPDDSSISIAGEKLRQRTESAIRRAGYEVMGRPESPPPHRLHEPIQGPNMVRADIATELFAFGLVVSSMGNDPEPVWVLVSVDVPGPKPVDTTFIPCTNLMVIEATWGNWWTIEGMPTER